jgi:hypothetical protein
MFCGSKKWRFILLKNNYTEANVSLIFPFVEAVDSKFVACGFYSCDTLVVYILAET